MLSLGLDLSSGEISRAVVIDDAGEVLSRAQGEARTAWQTARQERDIAAWGVAGIDVAAPVHLDGVPTARTFDAGAAAIVAEVWIGAARGTRHAVCLCIGERVFAGILLDGREWTGAHHRAGAAAWLALNPVERQDYRKSGSFAAEVGALGIARRLSWRIQAGDHSAVLARAGDLDAITATHVFDGARAGDGVAISVVRDTARYIGMAVASLAAVIDPEVIVIGGAVAAARELLLDPVRHECARRLPPAAMDSLRVEFSTLGEDAVAIGAARLAMTANA